MRKKTLLMLLGTLLIGIIIGAFAMSIFTHRKWKSFSEPPTKEKFSKRIIKMIDPDEAQLTQMKQIIDDYSDRASELSKENMKRMLDNLESLNRDLTPFLNDEQKQIFEKKINLIKSGTIK